MSNTRLVERVFVGLNPTMPHQAAGKRILPAKSEPRARLAMFVAMAPPLPPEDPPVVRALLKGLSAAPVTILLVTLLRQSYGVVVTPITIAPYYLSVRTYSHS